jgi:hypothetical protein
MNPILPPHECLVGRIYYSGVTAACNLFLQRKVKIPPNINFFYLPSDAQLNCLKINFKIYFKIDTKTALTCFGVIAIIRDYFNNCNFSKSRIMRSPMMVITPKYVGAVLISILM